MDTLAILYLSLLGLSIFVSVVLAGVVWARQLQPGARFLAYVGPCHLILAIASALEALLPSLPAKVFWVNVQYFGYTSIPVLYFLTVLHFLEVDYWAAARRWRWLFVVPAFTILLAFTNDLHHLMRTAEYVEAAGALAFLGKNYGLWWWVHICYSFFLMAASITVLLIPRDYRQACYRGQRRMLLIGLLIPVVTSVVYVCQVSVLPDMDFTPPLAAISGLIIVFSLLQHRLFDIVPVAREYLVESMDDGMLVVDMRQRIVDMNAACARIFALQPAQAVGRPVAAVFAAYPVLAEMLAEEGGASLELSLPGDGGERHMEVRVSSVYHARGHQLGRLGILHDITKRKQAQHAIQHMAYHDRLTDLPNRYLFQERMEGALLQAQRTQRGLAVLMLDLDGFKVVNDTLGHRFGDLLLCKVAARLRRVVPDGNLLFRLGGDEFVVLQADVTRPEESQALAADIRTALARPMNLEEHSVMIRASIGVSVYPLDGLTPDELLHQADAAMYAEKRLASHAPELASVAEMPLYS